MKNFEENLRRLDEIIAAIEDGDGSLEQSMTFYKEGMALAADCTLTLNQMEVDVLKLQKDESGLIELQPFKGE